MPNSEFVLGNKPISELAQELLRREMEKPQPMTSRMGSDANPLVPTSGQAIQPIDPTLVSLLAGGADAATTYNFLKNGTGRESNAMFGGSSNAKNIALGVAGTNLLTNGVLAAAQRAPNAFIRKVAGLAQPNFAMHQAGLASNNLDTGGYHASSDMRTLDQLRKGILGADK